MHADFRVLRCIFYSIVQKIYKDLHNELGIHPGEKYLILLPSCIINDPVAVKRGHIPQTLLDHIFHVFNGHADPDAALQPCHGQNVFKLGVEPVCILHDILINLVALLPREVFFIIPEVAGIAVYGCQGRTEIVRYGTQKPCPQPLVLSLDLSLFLLLGHPFVFKCHCTFMNNGQKDGGLKFLQRMPSHIDADHAVLVRAGVDTKVAAAAVTEMGRKSADVVAHVHGQADGFQFPGQSLRRDCFITRGKDQDTLFLRDGLHSFHCLRRKIYNGTIEQMYELHAGRVDDGITVRGGFQLIGGVQQDLRLVGIFRGSPGDVFHPDSDGTGYQSRDHSDQICHQIGGIIHQQSKARFNEQKIEKEDIENRGKGAVDPARSHDRSDQNAKNIDRDDIGVAETGHVEPAAEQSRDSHHDNHQDQIPQVPGRFHDSPLLHRFRIGRGHRVRNDVDVHCRQIAEKLFVDRRF